MNRLLESVRKALALITADGRVAVLIGGLAVSARSMPRFTFDADLAVAVDSDEQAESLVRSFVARGYEVVATMEQSGVDRLAGIRFIDPDGVALDVLTASSGIESEIVAAAEEIDVVEGFPMRVATAGHLIALKLLSVGPGRETDAADLRALASVATKSDWQQASEAVELIVQRGFNRDRDLAASLATLRREAGR
ncbi:MAG: hypothetical protein JWN62_2585 [Acidimicrobiales bacterium]|nr:hypothetical protein [Acidimicrobiales bacterium]